MPASPRLDRPDPTEYEDPPPSFEPDPDYRFLTLGGAEVHVHHASDGSSTFRVTCLGCRYEELRTDRTAQAVYAREEANDHAGRCRALPSPPASHSMVS